MTTSGFKKLKTISISLMLLLVSCQTIIVPESNMRASLKKNLVTLYEADKSSVPKKLTILKAREIALKNNPGLQASEQRILKARAVIDQAKSLYFPTVTAGFNARHQDLVAKSQFGIFPTPSYENYRTSLSSQWLIFDGFAREFKVLAARYGEMAAKEAYIDSQRMLVDAVSQSFYRSILAKKEMEINDEIMGINQKFLNDTEERRKAGAASRTEVNNFKVNVNEAKIALLEAKNSYEVSKVVLSELLGLPELDIDTFEVEIPETKVDIPDESTALSLSLNNRPDLKSLQADILATEAQIKEARGQYFPKVFVEGSYGTSSFDKAQFGDDKRESYIGAALSWDLFTGNSTAYLIAQREAEKEEKAKLLKSQWNEIISQVRQQRKSLVSAVEKFEVQKETAELNRTIYEDTQEVYKNGATSLTRVNEVLSNYQISRLNKALFQVETLRRYDVLKALMGTNLR